MGDNQQASPFPTPPPFYKHFTKQNIRELQKIQKTNDEASDPTNTLTTELKYLIPPEAPANGRWRTFGYEHNLTAPDPTLEEADIRRLYPDHPAVKLAPQSYLIALARSMLTTFLATCGVLAQNPSLYEQKTKDLKEIVFNMHDLINQYRPHQARESLILMMEEHIAQLRQEINTIEELKIRSRESIAGLQQQISDGSTHGTNEDNKLITGDVQIAARQRQLDAWMVLQGLDDEMDTEVEQEQMEQPEQEQEQEPVEEG